MMPKCIFRYQYCDGEKCSSPALNNYQYCKRHKNKENYIFELINMAIQNNTIQNDNDLYAIFTYIYNNDTYNVNAEIVDNSYDNKKKIFYAIVAFLLSKLTILNIMYKTVYLNGYKLTKTKIITVLHNIYYNTYCISKEESNIQSISRLQRCMRRYLYRKITSYNKSHSENTEDPFTFDNINEIPVNNKFSYKDNNNHIYIFNAIEFEYFIREKGAWNPYTKETIPEYVINQLYLLIKYNGLKTKKQDDFKWQTPLHAYTEVSQTMENAGFYTNVEWFNQISFETCKKIIATYRDLCKESFNVDTYFPVGYELNRITYIYDFCKEIINLFKDADEHYLLCCNFMKALAYNVREFSQYMPNWLLDEAETTRVPTIFMYVQDMLDEIGSNDMNEDDIIYDLITRRQLSLTATVTASFARILYDRF